MTDSRWRALIAYDGMNFHGFSRQPGALVTVASVLESALETVFQSSVSLTVAGRTDKGVHAVGQVVTFDAAEPRSGKPIAAINKLTGSSVRLYELERVSEEFSARFSARYRCYLYRLARESAYSPFLDGRVVIVPDDIDIAAMGVSVGALIGSHDFRAFCKSGGNDGRPTRRKVYDVSINDNGVYVDVLIWANSFCQQMVRSVVSVLIEVGTHKRRSSDVQLAVLSGDRRMIHSCAPPSGLYLFGVGYEAFSPLIRLAWSKHATAWNFNGPTWSIERV